MVSAVDRDGGGDLVVADAEQAGEFGLEMEERSARCGIGVQESDRAQEEVVKLRCRVVGFGDEFEEFDEICGHRDALVVRAQSLVRFAQDCFAEHVQFASPTARKLNLAIEEQVEHAGKAALRAASAFGHGLDEAVPGREPGDDEARFGELRLAHQQCGGRLHAVHTFGICKCGAKR